MDDRERKNRPGAREQDPWPVALRLLTRRDHSRAELQRKLLQRGFDAEAVTRVLDRCRQLGYLDDRRYAEQLARSLAGSGRAVGRRLELELKKRGIESSLVEQACAAVDARTDRGNLIIDLAARRYPGFDYARADDARRRRVVNFFLRRGFPLGEILAALNSER
ncbi:recombinase RecX [Geothermobacter hydrogeniphilus]|uniref:Regulatory protein RecX n=1 Tax=Geothermobacter hydrogeniphilus TaxID=1969733 RepID=A0A2K2H6Q1_9BACT|nr:recombinase RecX [Geothermobacter hydrogeniphilus]